MNSQFELEKISLGSLSHSQDKVHTGGSVFHPRFVSQFCGIVYCVPLSKTQSAEQVLTHSQVCRFICFWFNIRDWRKKALCVIHVGFLHALAGSILWQSQYILSMVFKVELTVRVKWVSVERKIIGWNIFIFFCEWKECHLVLSVDAIWLPACYSLV